MIGVPSLEALIDETVPANIRQREPLDWGAPMSERTVLDRMRAVAEHNKVLTSLIGAGYHGTMTPPVIQRNILENPAWYTAYTPYQPEISQGRLEALLNFQTMVCDLTGLDVANASLLDEATAAAEAMAHRPNARRSRRRRPSSSTHRCHPHTIAVIATRAEPLGWEVIVGDPFADLDPPASSARSSSIPARTATATTSRGPSRRSTPPRRIACVAADPLALTLLKPPGEMGADIAIGSTQRFGVPLGFGGPHAGLHGGDGRAEALACRGASSASRSTRAATAPIALPCRRASSTSAARRRPRNICTAQVLLAVMASMYAVFHGPDGLKAIAQRIHRKPCGWPRGSSSSGSRSTRRPSSTRSPSRSARFADHPR